MIDQDGYRVNVGIILLNKFNQVFWGQRLRQNSWQFPQGGVQHQEPAIAALYRELYEEVGLRPEHVEVLAATSQWHKYQLPKAFIRQAESRKCIGQKQKWFLLRLLSPESVINLNTMDTPEFSDWRWISYWQPIKHVIYFKKQVYQKALEEFYPLLNYKKVKNKHAEYSRNRSRN